MAPTTHFIGIGGIGMSGIARLLMAEGVAVSGSDSGTSSIIESLRAAGARIDVGHAAEHIRNVERVVVSSAIADNNPELVAAREQKIPVVTRGAMLAELVNRRKGIAIAGTHGKTTTTAMIAHILSEAELDPAILIGGEDLEYGTNAIAGKGEYFVTEADESDGSFLELRPHVGIITNVELDHVDHYRDLSSLMVSFRRFIDRVDDAGCVIVGSDNPNSATLAQSVSGRRVLTVGLDAKAAINASAGVSLQNFGAEFTALDASGRSIGAFALGVPGMHNVENALAAIATAHALELPMDGVARALRSFRGVRRRFEVLAETERMTLVDDYAHHPTAVEATIRAARAYFNGPIVAVFQPHRYSRTAELGSGFAKALLAADRVVLTSIYAASEAPIPGVTSRAIADEVRAAGRDSTYVERVGDLPEHLLATAPRGALVLMLGAGDITKSAAALAKRLEPPRAAAR